MGVLVDYFAASRAEYAGLDLSDGPAGAGWPHVDCKGWVDQLSDLVAELTGRDHSEFSDDTELLVENEGSWLERVRPVVTDALAGVSDERIAGYADDELLDEYETERITNLRDLARDATAAGRDVYCWSSL
jgi:hypothetical protein